MSQLVFLVVPLLDGDKDAQIVLAGAHSDGGASELGADLIKTSCRDPSFRTVNVKGRDWWMVGGLLR